MDFRCNAENWLLKIIDHASNPDSGCKGIAWADTVGGPFGIMCVYCRTRFTISDAALRADRSTRGQLLYDGVRTSNGKETLLTTLERTIAKNRAMVPKTAWERVLTDDDLV